MAWIRLDDQIAHHPKFNRCTPTACWLYVSCLGHAQKYLTNGFIAVTDLRTISHVRRPELSIRQLMRAGLLEKADGGYQIHDYLDFNESKEVVVAKRRLIHEIRSTAGKAGAMAKWQKAKQVASGLPVSVASNLPSPVSSPIPSHPSKNPPTPLSAKGGRVTRKELAHARAVLGKRFGRCQHDPECANPEDCVQAIAADRKRR